MMEIENYKEDEKYEEISITNCEECGLKNS